MLNSYGYLCKAYGFSEMRNSVDIDLLINIQIVVALEEEFECEIPDEKLLITEMDIS